jgi:hypothetical protein
LSEREVDSLLDAGKLVQFSVSDHNGNVKHFIPLCYLLTQSKPLQERDHKQLLKSLESNFDEWDRDMIKLLFDDTSM